MQNKNILSLVLLSCFVTSITPTISIAEVEEITVTAQRKEQNLSSVPIPVSAFGETQMKNLQINQPLDIGDNVPNLRIQPVTANGSGVQIHMRGASVQNSGFNSSESPVGIYMDDVYFGRLATINMDLNDIERVEVLRGPQGTLYGRNTIAGTIKFISRTPGDEKWLKGSLGYGEFDTLKVQASVGGPLVEGSSAASASIVFHERSEGWLNNPNTGADPGKFDNFAGRLKYHFYGDDKLSAKLQLLYADSDNDGANQIPYAPFNQPTSVPGAPISGFYDTLTQGDQNSSFGSGEQFSVSADIEYVLSDSITLRSITAFSTNEDAFQFDLAGGGFDAGPFGFVNGNLITSTSDNDTFSQELQFLGSTDNLEWLAGVYYLNERGTQFYRAAALPFFGIIENTSQDTDSISVFTELTYHLTDTIDLIGGIRYTADDKAFDLECINVENVFGCNPGSGATVNLNESFNEPTLKVGISASVADDDLVYGTISQGFQAGGFQTLCFGNTLCAQEVYQPQSVDNLEIGYKGSFLDNSVRLNATAFYAAYSDIQQTIITNSAAFATANIGDVDVYGLELELTASPSDNLSLFTNLGLLESDYGTLNPSALTNPSNELPAAPSYSYRLGFNYTTDLQNGRALNFGADYAYYDDYFSEATNALPIDSYNTMSAIVGMSFADGKYDVTLTGKNLTDEEIIYSGLVGSFSNTRQVLPPREWMLTFNFNY